MPDYQARLKDFEQRTDDALGSLEQDNRWAEALAVYHSAGGEADALEIPKADPAYKEARRLRAYLYLREANALRALGRAVEAQTLGYLELDAAMSSCDSLTIARAMFSLGGTCLANGEIERDLKFLDDAKAMFERRDDFEHWQGLGWWYLIQADVSNASIANPEPQHALEMANKALEILRPLENWPGVARAHAARARAYERSGDMASAGVALTAQRMAEAMLKRQGHGHND